MTIRIRSFQQLYAVNQEGKKQLIKAVAFFSSFFARRSGIGYICFIFQYPTVFSLIVLHSYFSLPSFFRQSFIILLFCTIFLFSSHYHTVFSRLADDELYCCFRGPFVFFSSLTFTSSRFSLSSSTMSLRTIGNISSLPITCPSSSIFYLKLFLFLFRTSSF